MFQIGLISDTHGLLRPEALAFLQGCDHIVHAGDIGPAALLETLARVAPLTVVRGNNDHGGSGDDLPETVRVMIDGIPFFVLHDLAKLDIDAGARGVRVVVSDHSHQPRVEQRAGVLFVNPGSAGPRRFRLPVSVAELLVDDPSTVSARVVELDFR